MNRERDQSHLEQQIDENLRKVYQRTVEEEVPDRLLSLLKQLKEQDAPNER
ncbi:NepR family anti-sigma factor [Pseudoruegeria sp. HB172150]|uniref:NepR family anti-sigma factor n=1 Tax=Pseudoruegeria sp. HB172150 TaxID=2721164 RepID=UPI00155415E4|nr:NepR family anti-sigma factor [Pseudoruegeria sp. HB172150]